MIYRRKGRQERGSDRRIITRVSEEEFMEWHRRADLLGITLSEYVRQCVRNAEINVVIRNIIDIKPLSEIAAQYGKIGNNINQVAHYLNSGTSWSEEIRKQMEVNLTEMYLATKQLARTIGEINGYRKTQSNEKFRL